MELTFHMNEVSSESEVFQNWGQLSIQMKYSSLNCGFNSQLSASDVRPQRITVITYKMMSKIIVDLKKISNDSKIELYSTEIDPSAQLVHADKLTTWVSHISWVKWVLSSSPKWQNEIFTCPWPISLETFPTHIPVHVIVPTSTTTAGSFYFHVHTLCVKKLHRSGPFKTFLLTLGLCPLVLDSPFLWKNWLFILPTSLVILYTTVRSPFSLLCSRGKNPSLFSYS